RGGAWRAAALPALCALLALLLQFGSQVQIEEYWLWKQDAGARRCFEELRRRQDQSPRVSVRVAAAAPLQPALDFYRVAWRTGWMEPVRAGVVATKPDADFVVVDSTEGRSEALRHYSTLWQDSTGTVVLEAPRP
ncbi:MAG TPA: hypothetical protein VFD43_11445, partial [Planctomycetota bacterium]|nr:hypothetical protein [Planctomycetota bacterium]